MSEQNDFPESWHWTPVGRALREIDSADTGPRRSFVILGAGVAGLATALELVRRGHRVEVIEGSDRVGGRVATHRFRNGSYGERGAMRIPLAHDYTHHYIREAKIPQGDLRRFWSSRGNGLVDVRGTVIRESENRRLVELFPGLTEEERRIVTSFGPGGLLGSAMGPLFQRLRPKYAALLAGDFSDPELAALDRISWRSYLETRTGLSEDGRALIGASLSIAAVWEWSLAAILRDEIHQIHPGGQSWTGVLCEIAGGLDRLPTALAALLPDTTIRFHARVLDIRTGGSGGTLLLEDTETGKHEEKPFERLLCTLPFPVLRSMPLETFSEPKRAAIQGIRYASATKVLLNYDRRWWESERYLYGGRSVSDRPDGRVRLPRQTYYPSDSVPAPCGPNVTPGGLRAESAGEELAGLFSQYVGEAPPGEELPLPIAAEADSTRPGTLLAAYTLEDGARELCGSGGGCVEKVLREIEAIHGSRAARRDLKEHLCWCWDEVPWAKGALAITPPGDLVQHFKAAKEEQGTVYFAGEHVSIAPGWIQGSLESSLREVARMLKNT